LATHLLDLVAGADGLPSGGGDLVRLLDGGRPVVVIVVISVDDAVVPGPQHRSRVRLVHSGVLRVHFHAEGRETWGPAGCPGRQLAARGLKKRRTQHQHETAHGYVY